MAVRAVRATPAAAAPAGGLRDAPFTATITVQLATAEHAAIAKQALEVDPELQPSKASREFAVHGAALTIKLQATELRVLRVVVASAYDMLGVVLRTLREFG